MSTNATGVTIHFVSDGLTLSRGASIHGADGFVARRGMTLLVTPEIRQANTGRDGRCVFDLTREQQEQRFGRVMFEVGELPEGFEVLVPGSFEHDEARTAALQAAALLPTDQERRIAAAKVRAHYGTSSEASSKTLAHYK